MFLRRFDLANSLTENDVFILPDGHHDLRGRYLPHLIKRGRGRSLAIFHDAARLRLASLYRIRSRRYLEYVKSLSAFDLVICVSQEAHDDLQDFWRHLGCKATSTCVEPWPAQLENGASGESHDAATNLVICVSSLDPRKNHLALLAAAERLWREGLNFELHIIGRGTKFLGLGVVSKIRKLRRDSRPIQWLRHVDDKTLQREYNRCRFTVYPSLMEGYGLPIVESLLHGKPCVCGDNGALGEVAHGGGCLIVDQTSVESLAGGIKKLLQDRELYMQLCAESRARKFRSWSDYVDRFLRYLQTTSPAPAIPGVPSH